MEERYRLSNCIKYRKGRLSADLCEEGEIEMKKMFTIGTALLLSLVFLLCSFTGCGTPANAKPETEQTNPTENQQTTQTSWFLTQLTEDCAASVELPAFIMEDESLKQLVIDYVNTYLADSFEGIFSLTLSNTDLPTEPADRLYYLDLSCRVTYEHEDFVSIVFEGLYNMKTAAHPINLLFSLNVNRYTNERVMLKDIWPLDDVFYDTYRPLAQAALTAKFGEDISIDDLLKKDSLLNGLQTEKEYCVYYTQSGMVISIPVIHALGDHFETEIPYQMLNWHAMPYEMIAEMELETSLFDGRFAVINKVRYYWCRFFDLDGNLIAEEHSDRQPHIMQPDDHIAGFWIQCGTGASAIWGYFYDATKGAISKEFEWILDATSDKVVCGNINGVTVYSIFDDSYCYEITDFEYPLPKLGVESVIDAEFSEDGKSVIVEYYKN